MTMISYIDFVHIGLRLILNKRPHVRGLATYKRGARVVSSISSRRRIPESMLRDTRADSESGRIGSVGPLPIVYLNRTYESCRHLSHSLLPGPVTRHPEFKSNRHRLRVDHGYALCLHGLPERVHIWNLGTPDIIV